ncbi:4-alpha-glucanotransferase [Dissulfurimicrobium hydrothermale]|uniref:4-alpha-glucanotransferase n=1 Tax=Dissulfurimicrobium hydrothermale TaxID=1750598 RepID=UPI001EDC5BB8|nr:4-alpha-glucanotransferase [Dissulfurimicrobium hydrothermale]UKL13620.1 4-alpha-glucanotransferase [Dissulfurimicrobium hydrothermale]
MEDIKELLRLCGIEHGYWDIWGKWHVAQDEAVMNILHGMGVLDGDGYEAALSRLKEDLWLRVLEPVRVVSFGSPVEILLTLPHEKDGFRFEWAVLEEAGVSHAGAFRPSDLQVKGSHEINGRRIFRYSLMLPVSMPMGYHRFLLFSDEEPGGLSMSLIVCPKRCYVPDGLFRDGRTWGPTVGLYALRSRRNWGIGDFGDLKTVIERFSAFSAGIVGTNPLCALSPCDPSHISPYSPSSRLFLNYLNIDIEAVPDFAECEEAKALAGGQAFQARLSHLREGGFVDYEGVAGLKLEVLEVLFRHFKRNHLVNNSQRAKEFLTFKKEGGKALKLYSTFNAISEYFKGRDSAIWGWPVWPEAYQDPDSVEVTDFASKRGDRVDFYCYLEWQAERQLAAIGQRSFELGLKVGLYLDLPVGVDRTGFDVWYHKGLFALNAGIGAPPDAFNPNGQDWGLPPIIPIRLKESAYLPFIKMLRRNMCHNGALRIDHVMGLMRLFWVPCSMKPDKGVYVRYPFEDLLGVLALESHRNRCMVIGEDLGTVPDEVRSGLGEADVFSTRVFYFETKEDGSFRPPAEYPTNALVSVTTHDLPTLYGFWQGRDVEIRDRLNLFPTKEIKGREITWRDRAKAWLFEALKKEGLVSNDMLRGHEIDDKTGLPKKMTPQLVFAVYSYLVRCRSKILAVQMEDLTGELDQANLPGTVNEYPNWKRRLSKDLEAVFEDKDVLPLLEWLRRSFQ